MTSTRTTKIEDVPSDPTLVHVMYTWMDDETGEVVRRESVTVRKNGKLHKATLKGRRIVKGGG